jgi:hypothetical protein
MFSQPGVLRTPENYTIQDHRQTSGEAIDISDNALKSEWKLCYSIPGRKIYFEVKQPFYTQFSKMDALVLVWGFVSLWGLRKGPTSHLSLTGR